MKNLSEHGLSVADITSGRINYEKIGEWLGVDSVVIGTVSPSVTYDSSAPSGKISTVAIMRSLIGRG